MDEAFELSSYLPVSYRSHAEERYIAFLWDAFQSNYSNEKFEFSCFAFHLLYMSFVSFSLWRIRSVRKQDFQNALIGFQREKEGRILKADTPFMFYENLKESEIFRFLKLLGCENDQVGEFSKFVGSRNKMAHPSGTVFFNDQISIDREIEKMMREVANIQNHMKTIVLDAYGQFLQESADIDARQYSLPEQEIEVNFIHQNYISRKDIEFCLAYDLKPHEDTVNFELLLSMHTTFCETYADAAA
jgi:hypothetical protein